MSEELRQKPITDEIATVEKDIFRDYLGNVLINPDKVIRSESGGKGVEIFEDLLFDDKVGSTLQTRKVAVVGKEWEIIPASDSSQDMKIADFLEKALLSIGMSRNEDQDGNLSGYDASRKMLLSGLVTGYKPGEIMWEYSEGSVWIREIIGRSPRRFVFDLQNRMRLLTLQNMVEGEELPGRKFITFRNVSDNGSPYGDGLGRMLYWPVWFKKNAVRFWMIFADKFGSPTAVGKYPRGTPKEQQQKLLDAIEAIQQQSAIKIPDNMVIELLEAARQGTVNTYKDLCTYMNGSIAQIMLGQTLTSEVGEKGSYAASKTHEDVRQEYLKADADMLCEAQNNTLIKWLVDFNFPGVTEYPTVWIRTDAEEDLKPLAERDRMIVKDIGLPVSKKYFYETYAIPEPEAGEELVEVRVQNIERRVQTEFSEGQPGKLPIDHMVDRLHSEASLDGIIKPIEQLLEEAESMEDFRDRLIDTYSGMDANDLGILMQRAFAAAELAGRYEVKK